MKEDDLEVRVLHDEATIAKRVAELAREIQATMPGDLVVVALLKGAFIFVADLVRALSQIGVEPGVDFMQVSSYGSGKESRGTVRLVGEVPAVAGRRVLLVDDIQDTGRSLVYARGLLAAEGALDIRTCVLADKPSRREVGSRADLIGFEVADVFLVGYGIDYAERFRHLPYIGTVD